MMVDDVDHLVGSVGTLPLPCEVVARMVMGARRSARLSEKPMKSAEVLPSRTAVLASIAKTGGTGGDRNERTPVWNPMTSFMPPRMLLLWAKTGLRFRMSSSVGGRRTSPRPR